ncbi:MAG: miaB [Rickettsiales bacterium]|jgi:tRNA-2-methylthio-N6-dimethylallyladenosine synthase|nr:miaB [Rickettsiales bacterium]
MTTSTESPKKLYIKTYGCQMNVYDSQQMENLLKPLGYAPSETSEDADMVILNTCHIREKAAEKMYSELGRIKEHKEDKKDGMVVAVAGCVGQAEGEEIFKRAPYVDIVVGPQSYYNLPELVARIKRDAGHAIDLNFVENQKFDALTETAANNAGPSAFVSVQEGCDKFCTFCVVPYTRGAEYSRAVGEVYRETVKLVAGGAKEIMLLGQNVNAYHGEGPEGKSWSLAELIEHLSGIDGLERIRYITSHPRDMHEALYTAHAKNPKLMPFLHLPVQAGSDRILKAMNRKHSRDQYFAIIDKFRSLRPDMMFSSDFIVGFPGETEEDFEQTLDLVRRVGYGQCYSFKYSPRPGTPGSQMDDQVPEEVKTERLTRLQELLNEQQLVLNQASLGKTYPILLDRKGRRPGQLLGRSPYMQSVYVEGLDESYFGQIIDVKITGAFPKSLSGEMVGSGERKRA